MSIKTFEYQEFYEYQEEKSVGDVFPDKYLYRREKFISKRTIPID